MNGDDDFVRKWRKKIQLKKKPKLQLIITIKKKI